MNFGKPFDTGDDRRNVHLAVTDLYCGCGNPEEGLELVQLLKAAPFYENRDRIEELLPSTGIEMLVLGALDNAELEHGGSIGGSWLTERGKETLRGLNRIASEEGYEAFTGVSRCVHGRDGKEPCPDCSQIMSPAEEE